MSLFINYIYKKLFLNSDTGSETSQSLKAEYYRADELAYIIYLFNIGNLTSIGNIDTMKIK